MKILVIQLSESFGSIWDQLAADVESGVRLVGVDDPCPSGSDVVAVVLAAGGAERDALDWLETHATTSAPVYAVGADPERRIGLQLVGSGASDYFVLPEDLELLRNSLASAVMRRRETLRREARAITDARPEAFDTIIGESPALKTVLARAARLLPHRQANALIIGETGTGKELLAQAIHEGGPRRTEPFVTVNCSALPEHLVESELFGHERGAFTDAQAAKPGLFEVADGGTLFLDEVGTLPFNLQAKLLRALETKEVRRVGGTKSRKVDLRIIAATNQNLKRDAQAGLFREDLYFRLSAITLSLPPLRERGNDVILIAETLLAKLAKHHGVLAPRLRPEARRSLRGYRWPGNVRELKNAVERALLLSAPGELDMHELLPPPDEEPSKQGPIPFPAPMSEISVAVAQATLEFCGGNRSEAARRLEISRQRLRKLLNSERLSA